MYFRFATVLSQEMELLVQRHHILLHLVHRPFFIRVHFTFSRALLVVAVEAHGGIEISDLVRILAGGGYFDGTGPVVVEVAQSKGQVLDVELAQAGSVQRHVEMRW